MPRNYLIIILILFQIAIDGTLQNVDEIVKKRENHQAKETYLAAKTMLAHLNDLDHFSEVIDNILIERVVGTPGHAKVRKYIVDSMEALNFEVELDEFDDETPLGNKSFANIVATLNSNAERFLVIACHYDSKYFKEEQDGKVFLGATDSAVPCSMMINIAHVMKQYLNEVKSKNDLSLKFIFFDGEEAFEQWTATDSIYGARHLAERWENEEFLHRIDMLVLLDLLGAPDPQFYALMPETLSWYLRLSEIEKKLSSADLLDRYTTSGVVTMRPNKYFNEYSVRAGIEDDHIPFMKRGVPIVHLIPVPFPNQWHTFEDDRKAIDEITCENLMKIFRIYIAEYLHLNVDVQ